MPRRSTTPKHPFTDAARGERLQKVLAKAGVGSRRHCEELIASGEVTVNRIPVTDLPAWVNPEADRIVAAGKVIERRERRLYIMLNKPRGVVTTNADPDGRPRAIDLVQHPANARLYAVGRMEVDATGLLLMTNDGELANRLTHARYGVGQAYEVTVRGSLGSEDVARLQDWLSRLGGGANVTLTLQKRDRERTQLLMEVSHGRSVPIREALLRLGHPLKKLNRVSIGPLRLKGVALGQWRELTAVELAMLRKAAGRVDRGNEKRSRPARRQR